MPENKINFMVGKNVYKEELTLELSKITPKSEIQTTKNKIKFVAILIKKKHVILVTKRKACLMK